MSEAEEMAEFLNLGWKVEPDVAAKAASLIRSQAAKIEALKQRAQQAETLIEHWKMRAASARNNTLEEVARKLEADGHRWAAIISAEIRAMKEG